MGTMLLIGGIIGSTFGVSLFKLLSQLGQIDVVIRLPLRRLPRHLSALS